jgi:hypothetical protein
LSNAVQAAVLATAAALLGWCLRRRPAVVHALWVLVLLKLVTPSLVRVDVPWTTSTFEPPSLTVATPAVELPPVDGALLPATHSEPANAATAAPPVS